MMQIQIEIVNWLRIANFALLVLTLIVLAIPARRAFSSDVQRGDVLWFLFWGDALNRTWFVARSLHFDAGTYVVFEAEILSLCYMFAILVQALIVRAYLWGRQ